MSQSLPCLNLPVYTKSGRYLGRIVEIEIDFSAQHVICYHVVATLFLGRLWRKRLIISPRQIVSLNSQAMIVDDNIESATFKVTTGLASEPS